MSSSTILRQTLVLICAYYILTCLDVIISPILFSSSALHPQSQRINLISGHPWNIFNIALSSLHPCDFLCSFFFFYGQNSVYCVNSFASPNSCCLSPKCESNNGNVELQCFGGLHATMDMLFRLFDYKTILRTCYRTVKHANFLLWFCFLS